MALHKLSRQLGPGLLFAASAVGVSHLVQSTRAGAEFGLTMGVLILVACLVKYPAFRFGAEYAAATGESVIEAYARHGRWLLVFCLLALAVEGLVVIPAVSLVAAGMTMNLLGVTANEVAVTMSIVAIASIALALGRYRLLERVSKLFVVLFAVLTVVATAAAITAFDGGRPLAVPIAATRENLFFAVAVAGWMPVGMGAAVFISLWICAKSRLLGRAISVDEARFDFNLGFAGTVALALCFLVMGTALLLGRRTELAASSAGFAGQLVTLFAASVGGWVRPVIGVAALAVMFSTVIAVVDAFPRVYATIVQRLSAGASSRLNEERLYLAFMAAQALAALGLLLYMLASFGVFIDFATTAGFVIAPVIALLNHRVIGSAPATVRPPAWLRLWSAGGAATLGAASLLYLYFRFP